MILRKLRSVGTACAMCGLLLAAQPGATQTVLSPDQMRVAASESLRAGRPEQAAALARALLTRDANDLTAHLVLARAERDLGRMGPALGAARTAWRLATSDGDKYAAALVTAQVLSSDNKRTRAQLWLRRAAQHAPTPALKARAQRDFRYVRQRNPWQTHLSFTLAPNSNINNGSARDRSELNYAVSEALFGTPVEFELTGAALALSGLEYGFGVKSRYRFHQTDVTAHDLNLTLSYRSFALSNSAKATAPDASGDDFAFGTMGIGYGYKRINLDRKGEFSADASIGQSWYGGARYASYVRGALAQTWRANRQTTYRFGLDLESQNGQRTTDVDTFELSGSVNKRLASGNTAFMRLGTKMTLSDNADSEFDEVALRAGYVLGKPVMGAAVQFGLGASLRNYDVSVHSRDGREDFKVFADVTATFKQIDYYGFNPSVSLSASSTDSNIGLFDSNRFGFSIGIKSAF